FLSKLFRVGLFQIRAHSLQIGGSLRGSHSRFQMSEGLKNSMGIPARTQETFAIHLLLVDDGHEKIGSDKQHPPAEFQRGYTDDGVRTLVHTNNTAHYGWIVLETAVPICVAKD